MGRELTKRHEEQVGPSVKAALEHFAQHAPQGEFTLVLGGATAREVPQYSDERCLEELRELIKRGLKASEAARELAPASGRSRRELYALLHEAEKQAD